MQPLVAEARKLPGVRVSQGTPGGIGRRGIGQPMNAVIGGPDYESLAKWSDQMLALAEKNPGLQNPQTSYKERKPQMRVAIDRDRAADLGISLEVVGQTLETVLGSRIVTTYVDRGREYNVIVQGRDDLRQTSTDLTNIRVRSPTDAGADSVVEHRAARRNVGHDAAVALQSAAFDQDPGRPRAGLHDGRGGAVVQAIRSPRSSLARRRWTSTANRATSCARVSSSTSRSCSRSRSCTSCSPRSSRASCIR